MAAGRSRFRTPSTRTRTRTETETETQPRGNYLKKTVTLLKFCFKLFVSKQLVSKILSTKKVFDSFFYEF